MIKQVDIQEIIPYLDDEGYVAMDENGEWWWYDLQPVINNLKDRWQPLPDTVCYLCRLRNIKPASDWTKSLINLGENK